MTVKDNQHIIEALMFMISADVGYSPTQEDTEEKIQLLKERLTVHEEEMKAYDFKINLYTLKNLEDPNLIYRIKDSNPEFINKIYKNGKKDE